MFFNSFQNFNTYTKNAVMWVVVPVKRFSNAKTRLADILSPAERESLAQVMLNDVLRAISESRLISGILVVSTELRARYAVERVGGLFLRDEEIGVSQAITRASDWLKSHGQRSFMMLPGDIPLASSGEIDLLIGKHSGTVGVTLAPDRRQEGTNGLIVSPTDVIPFCFGSGSFVKHADAARNAGVEPQIIRSDGLSLDIDSPVDLHHLLTHDGETESLAYLADSGVAKRMMILAESKEFKEFKSEIMAASRLM